MQLSETNGVLLQDERQVCKHKNALLGSIKVVLDMTTANATVS